MLIDQKVACQTILFNRGVCGTAAASATTQLVDDVEKFPGHIACDGASKSEIVVPIVKEGKVRSHLVLTGKGERLTDCRLLRLSMLTARS